MRLYHSHNGKRIGEAYKVQHVIRISPKLHAELLAIKEQGNWNSLNELIESILWADVFDEIPARQEKACESPQVCSSPAP